MKIYQKIIDEWKQDSVIDPLKLTETSIGIPNLIGKYLGEYGRACELVETTKQALEDRKLFIGKYYSGKMTKAEMDLAGLKYDPYDGGSKPLKSEIQKYIDTDKEIKQLGLAHEEAKTLKEIIKYILDDIKYRGNLLKLILDNEKFRAGV